MKINFLWHFLLILFEIIFIFQVIHLNLSPTDPSCRLLLDICNSLDWSFWFFLIY